MATSSTRAYVFLQSGRNRSRVVDILKEQNGVVAVDPVEGRPDLVLVLEAPNRRRLASVLVQAMASVEDLTELLHLFPTVVARPSRGHICH
jgi:hypothetical protein